MLLYCLQISKGNATCYIFYTLQDGQILAAMFIEEWLVWWRQRILLQYVGRPEKEKLCLIHLSYQGKDEKMHQKKRSSMLSDLGISMKLNIKARQTCLPTLMMTWMHQEGTSTKISSWRAFNLTRNLISWPSNVTCSRKWKHHSQVKDPSTRIWHMNANRVRLCISYRKVMLFLPCLLNCAKKPHMNANMWKTWKNTHKIWEEERHIRKISP